MSKSRKPSKAKDAQAPKRPVGAPSTYTLELAIAICEQVADGRPLISICQQEGMPNRATVRDWRLRHPEFDAMYTRAREEFADSLVDELLELADKSRMGVKTKMGPNGEEVTTGDMVERARIQIDTRKWLAAKILPKKYGEKIEVDGKQEVVVKHRWGG